MKLNDVYIANKLTLEREQLVDYIDMLSTYFDDDRNAVKILIGMKNVHTKTTPNDVLLNLDVDNPRINKLVENVVQERIEQIDILLKNLGVEI
jgi:hypothetical protein